MKKTAFTLLLVLGLQTAFTQNKSLAIDTPDDRVSSNFVSPIELDPPFDTVFKYPLHDSIYLTSIETDGNYYYTGYWMQKEFVKYDMNGNFVEHFYINGDIGFSDMAWDGQYFYGGRGLSTRFYTLDLANKTIVDSIQLSFKVKALAYNHDLDVFYANYWDDDIKVFKADGTVLDTIPLSGPYSNYIGFAYDGWTEGGPFLWGFSQDGSSVMLIQLELPSGNETGLYIDLNDYWPGSWMAGGLFTHPDPVSGKNILGGVVQNDYFFGLHLTDYSPPPTDSTFAVSYHHASLADSFDVQLNWSPAKYNILNEYFEANVFPPAGWTKETYNGDGMGWDNMIPNYVYWPVPETDSRFAIAYEDIMSNQRCCDYLITPELELISLYNYYLSFESYYDGSNNHSAYVRYTLDDGLNWNLLHTMVPDSGEWVKIRLDLTPIPADQPVKIAFHSDDNWGNGSGWAIDNVMIYSDDIPVNLLGYDVYRDGTKVNSILINDTAFVDAGVSSGDHEYYISAVYSQLGMNSGEIAIRVPYYPPPPPSPDCNPPFNLDANVVDEDITLSWNTPVFSITKDNAWNVQFTYPLSRDDEAGFTCDGNYFYTTYLTDSDFGQYDLMGNYLYNAPMFTPGARNLEYVPSTGNTIVTFERFFGTEIIKLPGGQWQGNFPGPGGEFAIAYNEDLDAFYINNNSSDILLVDRETGNVISSFICRTHGNYYDFAYDNWSEGGPYLWGFSADGPNGCTIVQISLPDGLETGFTYDASWLSNSADPKPGGLFIMEDLVPGTVSLCGIIQGDIMFGLELGPAEWDFYLDGYNVYMDGSLHNAQVLQDTNYLIQDPGPGTYNFEITAVYVDSIGDILCESPMEGPVSATITSTDVFLVGGNVIAGAYKLDHGTASIYRFSGGTVMNQESTEVDDLGYYLFPEVVPGDYMMYASPDANSNFFTTYIPTYAGNRYHWEDVVLTTMSATSYNNDINLIKIEEGAAGNGLISGIVYEDGTDSNSPLQNILVLLFNTEGDCIALDYTDQNGQYEFSGLSLDTYKLLVEITGKSMTPRVIYLSETSPEQTEIDLLVMNDEIVFGINDELPSWIGYISEIYPNPAYENSRISIMSNKTSVMNLNIIDISGHRIQRQIIYLNNGSNKVNIELLGLESGVYFVNLEFEGGYVITKKLLLVK